MGGLQANPRVRRRDVVNWVLPASAAALGSLLVAVFTVTRVGGMPAAFVLGGVVGQSLATPPGVWVAPEARREQAGPRSSAAASSLACTAAAVAALAAAPRRRRGTAARSQAEQGSRLSGAAAAAAGRSSGTRSPQSRSQGCGLPVGDEESLSSVVFHVERVEEVDFDGGVADVLGRISVPTGVVDQEFGEASGRGGLGIPVSTAMPVEWSGEVVLTRAKERLFGFVSDLSKDHQTLSSLELVWGPVMVAQAAVWDVGVFLGAAAENVADGVEQATRLPSAIIHEGVSELQSRSGLGPDLYDTHPMGLASASLPERASDLTVAGGVADGDPVQCMLEPEAMTVPQASDVRDLLAEQADSMSSGGVRLDAMDVQRAHALCKDVTRRYSKTFYLCSELLDVDQKQSVWAIYNWCRSTDELVDERAGSMSDLQAWSDQLNAVFCVADGSTNGVTRWQDVSFADAVQRIGLIKKPFQDMIGGMAMDLVKSRYATFRELEVYCYRVAGTVGLMAIPILGFDNVNAATDVSKESTIRSAMALGVAFQLTNILRDVGEDARNGRIYVPTEDLDRFGITVEDVLEAGRGPTALHSQPRWRDFMAFQIERCHRLYEEAEPGIMGLSRSGRLGVMTALFVYRAILDAVVANRYDNFHSRGYVSLASKVVLVGQAWRRVQQIENDLIAV